MRPWQRSQCLAEGYMVPERYLALLISCQQKQSRRKSATIGTVCACKQAASQSQYTSMWSRARSTAMLPTSTRFLWLPFAPVEDSSGVASAFSVEEGCDLANKPTYCRQAYSEMKQQQAWQLAVKPDYQCTRSYIAVEHKVNCSPAHASKACPLVTTGCFSGI